MGSKWAWVLMFVSVAWCLSQGCLDEERVALLQLKHFFNGGRYNDLSDWIDGEKNSDCCQWEGVECSNSTGRVIQLNLEYTSDENLGEWYLNASLFSVFEKLELLDLEGNNIAGFVEKEGLHKLSRLINLESLDLEYNMFNNDVLSSLSALSSLMWCSLSGNKLKGIIDLQNINSHNKLQHLDLSYNEIEEVIFPKDLNKLSGLKNLEYLSLTSNELNNDILSSLNTLPSLKKIYLRGNSLKKTINLQGINSHNKLQHLDLSNNEIEEIIFPKGLDKSSRLKNLEYLYLDGNKLNNDILLSLNALTSLKEISLSYNSLKGTINLQGVAFQNKLQRLNLDYNEIEKVVVSKGLNKLSRWSNLEYLSLTSNKLNNDILSSLDVFSSLKEITLTNNSLKGIIDLRGLDSCNKLQRLSLGSNEIEKVVFHKGLHKRSRLGNLKYLDLSYNKLKRIIDLQSLNNLETLMLSYNNLDNSILSSISALSSLKELYLDDNGLKEIVDISEFHYLNNLEYLSMGNNKIDKFIFSKDNTSLRNLSNFYLNNISIHDGNNLLQLLGSFSSLEMLDLSYNNFNETTTTGDFSHMKNTMNLKILYMDHTNLNIAFLQIIGLLTSASLEVLTLSNCGLQDTISHQDGGTLAEFLYHQHNLKAIDLSSNNLTGEFPNWLLENNSRLYDLNLANNSLGEHFRLPTHAHLTLTSLDISKNLFHGHIPKESGGYLPNLMVLNISKNYFNGSIPSSIGDMNSLTNLDLSDNQMSGKIPEHLVESCTSLKMLWLSNNSFQGQIFSSNFNLTNLVGLQLDGNKFSGKIPESLSNASYLQGLDLSDNNLSGTLPSWLGNMSLLKYIIMPNNHLEGPIPSEFCQVKYLTILNLAHNNLSGNLPYCFSSPIIEQIHLSKNRFQGQLNDFIVNSSFLVTLDLSHNQLHGIIPTWINLNFKLKYLILRNNSLSGELPIQLCQLNQLRLVDLSHNNLSGHIPPCLDLTALHDNHNSGVGVNVDTNRNVALQIRNEEIVEFTTKTTFYPYEEIVEFTTKTTFYPYEEIVEFTTKNSSYLYKGKVLTYMSGIDLSCNKLTGLIPQRVGNLTRIHTLNLSHNNLTGPIPLTFSRLKQIESLDLSYNNLNGKIPSQLVELNSLSFFSVACNNLSGKTPERIAQFGTFEENCYVGNPFLCGLPLNRSCDIIGPPPLISEASTDNDIDIFYMSFIGSYIIVLIGTGAVLYINPNWRRTWFHFAETWMIAFYCFVVDNLP